VDVRIAHLDELALTMAYEAGKPLRDARVEAERAADTFDDSVLL